MLPKISHIFGFISSDHQFTVPPHPLHSPQPTLPTKRKPGARARAKTPISRNRAVFPTGVVLPPDRSKEQKYVPDFYIAITTQRGGLWVVGGHQGGDLSSHLAPYGHCVGFVCIGGGPRLVDPDIPFALLGAPLLVLDLQAHGSAGLV